MLDRDGNVRATTGRWYWIASAAGESYDIDGFPAAVDCGYPWDFGQCDPNDEPALRAGISAAEHEESRAAYC